MENTGYKDVIMKDEEMANLIQDMSINDYGVATNEYLIVRRENGDIAYKFRWNGHQFVNISHKRLKNDFTGEIKPRNLGQELATDMMQNNDIIIKVLTGVQGAGKDMFMSAYAYDQILKGRKDRIVFIRNNIEVRNTKEIGHLPGEMFEKMLPWAGVLCDHLGGESQLRCFVDGGKVEIVPMCYLRGRDLRNAIVYVTEAENLTTDHIKLIMGRCSTNTELWVNGSFEQVDKEIFEKDNGMMAMIENLRGQKEFAHVHLEKTERGRIVELSEKL